MEKYLEIILTVFTVIGIMATVAAPILSALGKGKAAVITHDLGVAFMGARSLFYSALDTKPDTAGRGIIINKIGDQVSSFSRLKKYEVIEKAEQLLNERFLHENSVTIDLRPDGQISVNATPLIANKIGKIGKWLNKI